MIRDHMLPPSLTALAAVMCAALLGGEAPNNAAVSADEDRADAWSLGDCLLGARTVADLIVERMTELMIDAYVATDLLPVLAPKAPYPLFDNDVMRSEAGILALVAGERVRVEVLAALGPDAAVAEQIGTLLAERARIVGSRRLLVEHELEAHAPDYERARVDAIDEELAHLDVPRITARCHQLVAATIRVAPGHDVVATYLSQLANDPTTTQLTLWRVARFTLDDQWSGTADARAANVLLASLATQLQLPDQSPTFGQHAWALAMVPSDELRAAARALVKGN